MSQCKPFVSRHVCAHTFHLTVPRRRIRCVLAVGHEDVDPGLEPPHALHPSHRMCRALGFGENIG